MGQQLLGRSLLDTLGLHLHQLILLGGLRSAAQNSQALRKDNTSLWKPSPKPHFASPSFHRHKHTRGSVDSTFHSPGGRVRKNYAVNFKFLWEVPLFITANSAARSGALRTSAANSQL